MGRYKNNKIWYMIDMWYINIEKCIIILKNIINIWLLLCESKLKPHVLKYST